jgi:two-component system nitrogen regulation sensor histidine kinase NtrY
MPPRRARPHDGDLRLSRVKRTIRWSVLGGVLLAALWGFYWSSIRVAEAGPNIASSPRLVILLTLAIIVLALAFVGILVRNLVRLIVDRKRGVLGARLRTKLVFFFLALVLLPAFLLFFGAGAFIKTTLVGLIGTPVEEVSRQAKVIAKEAGQREESRLLDHARLLAGELSALPADAKEDARRVAAIHWRQREGFDVAGFALDGGTAFVDVADATTSAGLTREIVLRAVRRAGQVAARTGAPVLDQELSGAVVLLVGASPIDPTAPARGAAVAGVVVRTDLKAGLELLDAADRQYTEARAQRRELLRLYSSILALVGLAIVFVASWIGFYVARRITVPLEQMAAASREISAGNLGVRVLSNVGDEVGQLVEAFNEMAGQLQESREVITRGTADLRRTNQALDERRRYIETLVAQLGTAVLSVDRNGRVTTANPAVTSMLGLPIASGDDLRAALTAAGLDPLARTLDEAAARGGRDLRRELVLDKNGASISVSVHVSPLRGTAGDDLGTLVMVEDLTDLLEAQRLAAWREVARRVAHEIKNPLTPIQLAAQRLRKKWDERAPDLGDVVADAAATIEREVLGLKSLVDEFSLYARMPAPSPSRVDFGEIVRSVVTLYGGHQEVVWNVRIDPALGIVRLDADQMRRALINLIDNAVSALRGKGRIEIAASPWAGPGSLRVEVADSGPGIDAVQRDKVFTPYFSTKPRGTGLGLAIVQRIVVEHHGSIRVEDNAGGGARFIIEIPGDGTADEARAEARQGSGGRHES